MSTTETQLKPYSKELNVEALFNPQPGDYWQEMFCPYLVVVAVKGSAITVLSCMGGPQSYSRKHELNAKIEYPLDNSWGFDYTKHMVVDYNWMKKAVTYGITDGFVADVVRSESSKRIAEEWKAAQIELLTQQLKDLG